MTLHIDNTACTAAIDPAKKLIGQFKGKLDLADGRLTGVWKTVLYRGRRFPQMLDLKLDGILQPTRAVHFAQRIDGKMVGGVTYAVRWSK